MISETLRNPLSLFEMSGRSALVTGATGAFGRAVSLALAAMGVKLTIAGSSKEELDAVAAEIVELGSEAVKLYLRPDSLHDAEAMRDAALAAYGRLDQLVIASGYNKAGFIQDQDYEEWQAIMDANVRGAWFMAKAVGKHWIDNKIKGKVVLMSSVRGRHGNVSGYTGYCTSKGASDALTRVLATKPFPAIAHKIGLPRATVAWSRSRISSRVNRRAIAKFLFV